MLCVCLAAVFQEADRLGITPKPRCGLLPCNAGHYLPAILSQAGLLLSACFSSPADQWPSASSRVAAAASGFGFAAAPTTSRTASPAAPRRN